MKSGSRNDNTSDDTEAKMHEKLHQKSSAEWTARSMSRPMHSRLQEIYWVLFLAAENRGVNAEHVAAGRTNDIE